MPVNPLQEIFNSLKELLFPEQCINCSRSLPNKESWLCVTCENNLPRTNFHQLPENPITELFKGRVSIEYATAFLYFKPKTPVQKLLHLLKYDGKKEVGEYLGKLAGQDLLQSKNFPHWDMVIPIPLHEKKLAARGYNQSVSIAKGITDTLNIPLAEDIVQRGKFTSTQTKKSRYDRALNVEDAFTCMAAEKVARKHILLIDDVVTTGATIEACAKVLLECGAEKISVAAIAFPFKL